MKLHIHSCLYLLWLELDNIVWENIRHWVISITNAIAKSNIRAHNSTCFSTLRLVVAWISICYYKNKNKTNWTVHDIYLQHDHTKPTHVFINSLVPGPTIRKNWQFGECLWCSKKASSVDFQWYNTMPQRKHLQRSCCPK